MCLHALSCKTCVWTDERPSVRFDSSWRLAGVMGGPKRLKGHLGGAGGLKGAVGGPGGLADRLLSGGGRLRCLTHLREAAVGGTDWQSLWPTSHPPTPSLSRERGVSDSLTLLSHSQLFNCPLSFCLSMLAIFHFKSSVFLFLWLSSFQFVSCNMMWSCVVCSVWSFDVVSVVRSAVVPVKSLTAKLKSLSTSAEQVIDSLIDRLIVSVIRWLIDLFIQWLIGWLIDLFGDWLIDLFGDWLID